MKKIIRDNLPEGKVSCTTIPEKIYTKLLRRFGNMGQENPDTIISGNRKEKRLSVVLSDVVDDHAYMSLFTVEEGDELSIKLTLDKYEVQKPLYQRTAYFEIHVTPKFLGWSHNDGNVFEERIFCNMPTGRDEVRPGNFIFECMTIALQELHTLCTGNTTGGRVLIDHSPVRMG